jgi:CheY-like chemotaxis protein
MRPHRILVVDDDPGLRRTLERILEPPYQVAAVAGASEALARVAGEEFDLALLDVRLKEGDGYSLCKTLRQSRPQMDVILITGSISEPDEKLFRSLEEGAFYFLFKPFDRRVLLALVERCLRLQRERFAKERYAEELAADLERARRFQQSLVPRGAVAGLGWRVEGRLLSCDALGGDFYVAQADGEGLVVAVCDVVGHGVSAAMYAGMLRSTLSAAWRQGADPARVARELLAGVDFLEGATCATMIYALLLPDGRVRLWSAGHPAILCLRAAAGGVGKDGGAERLPSTGPLLHWMLRRPPAGPDRRRLRGAEPGRPGAGARPPGRGLHQPPGPAGRRDPGRPAGAGPRPRRRTAGGGRRDAGAGGEDGGRVMINCTLDVNPP